LRRIATLVAKGAPAEAVFAVVAEQVTEVLGLRVASIVRYEPNGTAMERASVSPEGALFVVGTRWSLEGTNVVAQIRDSGRPARIDDYTGLTGVIAEMCRSVGIRSTVGSPIGVAGRLWGAIVVSSTEPDPLPSDTEDRLAHFTELVATAIANGEAREELERLADEQAALRRIATLVARGIGPEPVFRAVADEVQELFNADGSAVVCFEADRHITVMGSRGGQHVPGQRVQLDPDFIVAAVRTSGRAARLDTDDPASPEAPELVRETGLRSAVASPIVVGGKLWGAITVGSREHSLPAAAERRLADFTELVATAVSNAEARAEVQRLADEQTALRRVATLVASEAPQAEVFMAIAEEIGRLLSTREVRVLRYDSERSAVVVGSAGSQDAFPVGSRQILEGDSAASRVLLTGRTSRTDVYDEMSGPLADTARSIGVRSVVGAPVHVEGRLWGAITMGSVRDVPLPPDTETRLGQFTDLMATAIANAHARAEVERLAKEQAALRRVATLVAEGAVPTLVFNAVAAEMEALLHADHVVLSRYESDAEITVVAHRGPSAQIAPPGTRVRLDGENVQTLVRRTKQPARIENLERAHGTIADMARTVNARMVVGAPIVVEGRLWGVISASWTREESPAADTEERMSTFAELLDTAIANADSRDQLRASRARLLTEADDARRRVVRDLHDGAQQRLVHSIISLKLAKRALYGQAGEAASLVEEALTQAEAGNAELRELAHGILPSVLARGGLRAGIDTVVAGLDLPVQVDVTAERFSAEVEASAYFIVAEALTNVVKHAEAARAEVRAFVDNGMLHVEVRDDGIGGVDPDGHGLVGLADRATALGGQLRIENPARGGTLVAAVLPLSAG
jgi:GAF domain-containing protein